MRADPPGCAAGPATHTVGMTSKTTTSEKPAAVGDKKGEGDYESAERYQREATAFAKSGKVAPAAEDAKEAVEGDEADELAAAEVKGRSRSKGDDE
jgi:hypothetical protein